MSDDTLIAAMQRPEMYPHRPDEVTLVQTHISYVFLAGSEVYKIKKPVRFPFLDFSTLERRRFFCGEELRLNRRLAAEIYLEVVGIRREGAGYRLTTEDDKEAIEYAVRMRRLPGDRILTALLERGEAESELIDSLVDLLAKFHAEARADDEVTACGSPSSVARLLEDNFSSARRFRDQSIASGDDDAIQAYSRRFIAGHESLLRRRQAERRIRECHGDLHTEHVCCTDPIAIFDCIEFDPRLRSCDVAAEIAFLKMDLDFHERGDLADRMVSRYAQVARDPELSTLIPFYACYRAYVRGLVDSLTAAEREVTPADRQLAARGARRHFELAYRYTWAGARGLLVVSGLSGTGKSTLAEAIRQRTGFAHINTDLVRKRLAGIEPRARLSGKEAEQLYAPEMSARTYATMYAEASAVLESGRAAIIDGTFQRRQDRDEARQLAARHGAPILIVECECDADEVHRRLTHRQQVGESASDADWQIYLQQRGNREPIDPSETDVLRVDTSRSRRVVVSSVEGILRERLETSR
jgi:aminoglycoside phosphotransferase family enzyme/predicted kinase